MKHLLLFMLMNSCCCIAQESKEARTTPRITLKHLLIPPVRWVIPIAYMPPSPGNPGHLYVPPLNHNASDSPHPRVKRKKLTIINGE